MVPCNLTVGLPRWLSREKNLPAKAGDSGSISDLGRSHTPQGNKTLMLTHERVLLEPGDCNYWSPYALEPVLREGEKPRDEKPMHRN